MPFTAEAKREFDSLYHKATQVADDSKLVAIVFKMIDMLAAADEGYETYVKPNHMGIHPKNRCGKKMQPLVMHKKGKQIQAVGFTPKLCQTDRAIAFEENTRTRAIEKHTLLITETSDMFQSYKPGAIRAGNTGCGHLNQWIGAMAQGARCPYEHLCMPGTDKMCKRRVCNHNKDLEQAVEQGLKWFLIKASIEEQYPDMPELVQRTLNVEHHIGVGISV